MVVSTEVSELMNTCSGNFTMLLIRVHTDAVGSAVLNIIMYPNWMAVSAYNLMTSLIGSNFNFMYSNSAKLKKS